MQKQFVFGTRVISIQGEGGACGSGSGSGSGNAQCGQKTYCAKTETNWKEAESTTRLELNCVLEINLKGMIGVRIQGRYMTKAQPIKIKII